MGRAAQAPVGGPAPKARVNTWDSMVSELFDPDAWKEVEGFDFTDITYHRAVDQGTVRIAFNRPEVRNAFRPHTVDELYRALDHARMSSDVGVRAAHRQRALAQGRRLGVLLGRRPADPRQGRLQVRRGGDRRRRSTRRGRAGCTSWRCSG